MHFGNISAALYNTHRKEGSKHITWRDIYPETAPKDKTPQTMNDMQEVAKSITRALGGSINGT